MYPLLSPPDNDWTHNCPDEIMTTVGSWLRFEDIVRAMHVCTRWRSVFRDHPNFWKSILIRAHSPAALDKYQSQLHASRQRPISIICYKGPTDATAARLFATFADNLYRLTMLIVMDISPAHSSSLFNALSLPAPLLEKFYLYFNISSTRSAPSVPCHVFAGDAPNLREVQFLNLRMSQGNVRAFEHVVRAYYAESDESVDQCGEFINAERWLALFPSAREVGFRGAHKPDPLVNRVLLRTHLERIESLILSLDDRSNSNLDFLLSLPDAVSIPRVRVTSAGPDTVVEMLTHIRGPCELSITHEPRNAYFNTCLRDLQSGRRRVFTEDPADYVNPADDTWGLALFHDSSDWEGKVTELLLEVTLWPTLSRWLPVFSRVTRMTLRLDADGSPPLSALAGALPLSLPKLVQLTIQTMFEVSFLRALDICAVIDQCTVAPPPKKVTLVLKGPIVVDDVTVCARHFLVVVSDLQV